MNINGTYFFSVGVNVKLFNFSTDSKKLNSSPHRHWIQPKTNTQTITRMTPVRIWSCLNSHSFSLPHDRVFPFWVESSDCLCLTMSGELKSFLHMWCQSKGVPFPTYDTKPSGGSKHRQRFLCEVCNFLQLIITKFWIINALYMATLGPKYWIHQSRHLLR